MSVIRRRGGAPEGPALEAHALALVAALAAAGVAIESLTINDNRSRVVSCARRSGGLALSIHWSVLPATGDLAALILRRDEGARRRIVEGFQPVAPVRPAALDPAGRHPKLAPLFEQENAARFSGALALPFGWSTRRRHKRAPRSLRLGSYRAAPPRITLHPVLDHPSVPRFFVRFVLFHEMLHAALPPVRMPGGRRVLHGREFRDRERAHPDFRRAERWEAENLPALLRRARDP